MTPHKALLALRLLWALPCSAIGVALGLLLVGIGGSAKRVGHTIEFALTVHHEQLPKWALRLRFSGITFGHVILGQSHEVLAVLRPHERVHVRQYERLGPLFFIAYPASSLVAMLSGQCPYRGNRFEQEASASARAGGNAA